MHHAIECNKPLRQAMLAVLVLVCVSGHGLVAQAYPVNVLEVERLPDGRTLMVDSGDQSGQPPGVAFLVEQDGTLVHSWLTRTEWTHSVDWLGDGMILLADSGGDRVIEVSADGTVLWSSDDVSPLSDGSHLDYPNDVKMLASGTMLVSDRNNQRVLEIDRDGNVVWQHGVTGVPGAGNNLLWLPHNSERLPNGNTLISDTRNDRVIEVTPSGSIAWSYGPSSGLGLIDAPRDADLLPDGSVLITSTNNARIVRVSPTGTLMESIPTTGSPYEADLLPNGRYLVSGGYARELDAMGNVLWAYPPQDSPTMVTPSVLNPTSGVNLAVTVHVPANASPANRRPAVVMVPGGNGSGGGFLSACSDLASLGYVAVHFDPDGRGQSTNGGTYTTEDYCGFLQQDGLHEVLSYVASRADVDPDRICVYTRSYGITMGTGALARYPNNPPVALLLDFEGPAGRFETSGPFGGHVPVSPGNTAFWGEREALTFMPQVESRYVRLQTEVDHHPPHPGNQHAIDLATAALPSNGGAATLSRIGLEWNNPTNIVSNPTWISESVQGAPYSGHFLHLALQREMSGLSLDVASVLPLGSTATLGLDGGVARAGDEWITAVSLGAGPSFLGAGWLALDLDAVFLSTLQTGVLDASGFGTSTYPVPSSPWLSGLTLYTQAVISAPSDPVPYVPSPPVTLVLQ
ncbi:MAG: hypothetical protein HRU14_10950 [Planctomycetes bacterium]|nr:hypothetical protein [Planctomycetota bacterium]